MLLLIIKQFWIHRFQFLRYFITGTSGFILDMGTLIFFKEIIGLTPLLSVILNQLIIVNYIFLLNKFWTFKARGVTKSQALRFWLLMGWNYMFAIFLMWLGNSILNFNYILVRIAGIAIVVTWNFWLYKYWIFVDKVISLKLVFLNLKFFLDRKSVV